MRRGLNFLTGNLTTMGAVRQVDRVIESFGQIPFSHLVAFGVIEFLTLVILAVVVLRFRWSGQIVKGLLGRNAISDDSLSAHEKQCNERQRKIEATMAVMSKDLAEIKSWQVAEMTTLRESVKNVDEKFKMIWEVIAPQVGGRND